MVHSMRRRIKILNGKMTQSKHAKKESSQGNLKKFVEVIVDPRNPLNNVSRLLSDSTIRH